MEWIRDVGNVFSIERNLISFRQLVHMDIPVFKKLVSFLLSDDVPRQKQPSILKAKYGDARYGSRNVEMIVLCGVLYLTSSCTIMTLEMTTYVPYSTLRLYASIIIDELLNKYDSVITMPPSEKQVFMHDARMRPLKGAVFAIDGTHCTLRFGGALRNVTYSHKKKHSINTLIVCDWNMNIVHANTCFTGRTHDMTIWKESALYKAIQQCPDEILKRIVIIILILNR